MSSVKSCWLAGRVQDVVQKTVANSGVCATHSTYRACFSTYECMQGGVCDRGTRARGFWSGRRELRQRVFEPGTRSCFHARCGQLASGEGSSSSWAPRSWELEHVGLGTIGPPPSPLVGVPLFLWNSTDLLLLWSHRWMLQGRVRMKRAMMLVWAGRDSCRTISGNHRSLPVVTWVLTSRFSSRSLGSEWTCVPEHPLMTWRTEDLTTTERLQFLNQEFVTAHAYFVFNFQPIVHHRAVRQQYLSTRPAL